MGSLRTGGTDDQPVRVRDQRKPGWWWAEAGIFRFAKAIRPSGVAVYVLLCRFADNRTGKSWPSVVTMAETLGVSRDVVITAIDRLVRCRLILRDRPNRRKSTIYTLLSVVENLDVENVDVELSPASGREIPSEWSRISTTELDSGTRLKELESENGHFDRFWIAYPRKQAKIAARKAWEKTRRVRPPLEALLAALERDKTSEQWRGGVVPHAATWLNGRRWDDEQEKPAWESSAERLRGMK